MEWVYTFLVIVAGVLVGLYIDSFLGASGSISL